MKILAIGQVEDDTYIREQIAKQSRQPDEVYFYIDENPADTIETRRERIADNHQKLVDYVKNTDCDYIWQLEGDAELSEEALETLVSNWESTSPDDNIAYFTGVQVGRHGLYALGAWHIAKDRTSFESLDYRKTGIQQIDASGFYCLLAPKNIWLKGKASWSGEIWGPDVNFGLSLKKYKILADCDLHIGHKVKGGIIRPSDVSTCNVKFKRDNRYWTYKQLD